MPGQRPRVLVVITLAEVGGAQTYVASLLPALAERFDVTLAAYGPGPLADRAHEAGVRFVSLRHVRRPVNPWQDLLGLVELVRLFRRERPDLVHLNSSKASLLGLLAAVLTRVRLRVVTINGTVKGWGSATTVGRSSFLVRRLGPLQAALTTATVCVSEEERRVAVELGAAQPERTVVIHNAVDVASLPRRHEHNGPARLISVGRLRPPKDYVTLVRALAALAGDSFHAQLVGDGPDRPALEAELAACGLNGEVELTGERGDVPELLAGSDALVLSSRSEGLPLSVLEAMAIGLPVVASAVGGIPELVTDGETGFLVAPGDPDALADRLSRLIADPELRRRMGDAGRLRVRERFDLPAMQRAHVELYERLLAGSTP
jgi:glycosyltransferase involved in cell wall biosynthesis